LEKRVLKENKRIGKRGFWGLICFLHNRGESVEGNKKKGIGKRGFWGLIRFLHDTKFSSVRKLKNCIRGRFYKVYEF